MRKGLANLRRGLAFAVLLIRLFWLDEDGRHPAPHAKLILYPKYPEVRLSGFLRGCRAAPNEVLNTRMEGRVLVLGITEVGDILAYAALPDSPVANQIRAGTWEKLGALLELPLSLAEPSSPRLLLLNELQRIHQLGWIAAQKLRKDGVKASYKGQNAGG